MSGIDSSHYRYGFASGNIYRFKGFELEVRNLKSGLWESSSNPLLTRFIFGRGVLPGGSEEADRIFKVLQVSLNKTI